MALEAAQQHAEHVTVLGIGDERAKDAVKAGLRAGADEAIHVEYDPIEDPIGEKYGTVLGKVIEQEEPETVFIGDEAPTMDIEVITTTAADLGWRSTTGVTGIGTEDVDGHYESDHDLLVQRRVALGEQEIVGLNTPVVLGIDSGFANPSRGSMDSVLAAQRASIRTLPLDEIVPGESRFSMSIGSLSVRDIHAYERVGHGAPPRHGSVEQRIHQIMGDTDSDEQTAGEIIDDSPEHAIDQVVSYLEANEVL
ncbi:electron transfer flavoprotein alpha/beta- subunit [Halodesulfurarchaeum formicicum]|uniref:Electron transfer flavoprotein alpha/beta-subunit n=1 Tax=Halodesulfurarchaeum formicicum TaxID=1873524 RepID=A0A1D8S261_9EURY|nr:electron transfer flavoprotein alpha/beta- subunit [Halodesulfurarchaeum formicicum]